MPSSVVMRTTGLLAMTAHLMSVIFMAPVVAGFLGAVETLGMTPQGRCAMFPLSSGEEDVR